MTVVGVVATMTVVASALFWTVVSAAVEPSPAVVSAAVESSSAVVVTDADVTGLPEIQYNTKK